MKRTIFLVAVLLTAATLHAQYVTYDMLKNVRMDQTHYGNILFGYDARYNIGSPTARARTIYIDSVIATVVIGGGFVGDTAMFAWKSLRSDSAWFAWLADTANMAKGLWGMAVKDTTPGTGDYLKWSGTEWVPAAGGGGTTDTANFAWKADTLGGHSMWFDGVDSQLYYRDTSDAFAVMNRSGEWWRSYYSTWLGRPAYFVHQPTLPRNTRQNVRTYFAPIEKYGEWEGNPYYDTTYAVYNDYWTHLYVWIPFPPPGHYENLYSHTNQRLMEWDGKFGATFAVAPLIANENEGGIYSWDYGWVDTTGGTFTWKAPWISGLYSWTPSNFFGDQVVVYDLHSGDSTNWSDKVDSNGLFMRQWDWSAPAVRDSMRLGWDVVLPDSQNWNWYNWAGDTIFSADTSGWIHVPLLQADSAELGSSSLTVNRYGQLYFSPHDQPFKITTNSNVTPAFSFQSNRMWASPATILSIGDASEPNLTSFSKGQGWFTDGINTGYTVRNLDNAITHGQGIKSWSMVPYTPYSLPFIFARGSTEDTAVKFTPGHTIYLGANTLFRQKVGKDYGSGYVPVMALCDTNSKTDSRIMVLPGRQLQIADTTGTVNYLVVGSVGNFSEVPFYAQNRLVLSDSGMWSDRNMFFRIAPDREFEVWDTTMHERYFRIAHDLIDMRGVDSIMALYAKIDSLEAKYVGGDFYGTFHGDVVGDSIIKPLEIHMPSQRYGGPHGADTLNIRGYENPTRFYIDAAGDSVGVTAIGLYVPYANWIDMGNDYGDIGFSDKMYLWADSFETAIYDEAPYRFVENAWQHDTLTLFHSINSWFVESDSNLYLRFGSNNGKMVVQDRDANYDYAVFANGWVDMSGADSVVTKGLLALASNNGVPSIVLRNTGSPDIQSGIYVFDEPPTAGYDALPGAIGWFPLDTSTTGLSSPLYVKYATDNAIWGRIAYVAGASDRTLYPVGSVGLGRLILTDATGADSSWWYDTGDSTIIDSDNPMRIGHNTLYMNTDGSVHIPWLTVDSSLVVSVSRADTLGTSLWTDSDSTLYQYAVIDTTVIANEPGRWNWQLLDKYGYAQVARQIGNAASRILADVEGPASTTLPWRASLYASSTGNDESENSAIVFRLAQLYTYWHPYPFGHPYYPGRWEWRQRGSDSLVVMDSSGFNVNYPAYFNSDVYGGQFYSRYGDFFSGDPETWTGISMGSYDNSDAWVYAYYTDKLTLGADFGKYIRMVADSGVLIGDSWGLDSLWLKVNNDSAIIDANKPMRIGHNSLKIGTDGVVSFDDLSSKGGSWTWRSAYTDSLLMSLDTLQFGLFPGSYPVLRMYYYTPDWALADSVVLAPNGLSYFTSLNVGGFSSSTISAVDFVDAPVIGREFHNGRDTMRFQAKEQMFTAWRTIGDDIPVVEKGHHTFYVGPTDSVFRTSEHGVDYWKWLNLQKNLSGIRFVDESNNDFGGMWVNSSGEPEIWGPRPSYDGTMSFAYLDRIRLTSSLGDSIFFELTADSAIIDANKPIRIGHSEVNAHVSLASIAISAPKLTTAGRLALSPAEGDLVYDLTLHRYFYWNGSDWTEF